MDSYAMGLYPLTNRNKEKLKGCYYHDQIEDKRINGKVFIFENVYLHLRIDLVFIDGELYISDYYGNSMMREDIEYVFVSGRGG